MIGIAGPPGSGKSTLAQAVVDALNVGNTAPFPHAQLLPMDGYHLDNRILEPRGLLPRKGAPETFDATGFCAAVRALSETREEVFRPAFDRHLDLAVANAIAIHPDTPILIVEGNYLLLDTAPWTSLADVFAATVVVAPGIDVLRARLRQRWIDYGLHPDAALHRAESNDIPNAQTVLDRSRPADLVLSQGSDQDVTPRTRDAARQ